jgi:hypothetical protein
MESDMRPSVHLALLTLLVLGTTLPAADPTIAVWDPELPAKHTRFTIDPDQWKTVDGWLKEAGMATVRANDAAINAGLDPAKHPVLVTMGDVVVRSSIKPLLAYMQAGGIILGLAVNQGHSPFIIAIERGGPTGWQPSPPQPNFAWQNAEMQSALGMRFVYNPAFISMGSTHTPTALLERYLPGSPTIERKLFQHFIHVFNDKEGKPAGTVYPLVNALRPDGVPAVPSIYLVQSGKSRAIITNNPAWTAAGTDWWKGKDTLVALARVALDWSSGKLTPDASMAVSLPETPSEMEPFRSRKVGKVDVDPDGFPALRRWGRFDGSGMDLGEPVPRMTAVELADKQPLPRSLLSGASISLPMPQLGDAPAFLRIRFAFRSSDAGLSASIGDTVLLNEQFSYINPLGESNFGSALTNQPVETQRIVFIPPTAKGPLVLSNPGREGVWFDAIQIEQRPIGGQELIVGAYVSFGATQPGGKFAAPQELTSRWGMARCDARLQHIGPPDDPARWDKLDGLMEQYRSYKAPLHVILLGTPAWAADPASLAEAKKRGRPHICTWRTDALEKTVGEWLDRYGKMASAIEVANEIDIQQFWLGSSDDYAIYWTTIYKAVRARFPNLPVIAPGLAHGDPEWVNAMIKAGIMRDAALLAIHPYAGETPAWDLPYGNFVGLMLNLGIGAPIFANEQGLPWANCEWFKSGWTPQRQATGTDIAMGRLFASGTSKVCLFTGGGDDHPFSMMDGKGIPRPAYLVYADYLKMIESKEPRRLDAVMRSTNGSTLRGVYIAGSLGSDGIATLVVNPSEAQLARSRVTVVAPVPDDKPRTATVVGGIAGPAPALRMKHAGKVHWVEFDLDLANRQVIRLAP